MIYYVGRYSKALTEASIEERNRLYHRYFGNRLKITLSGPYRPPVPIQSCGFIRTMVQLTEPWLGKSTIRRGVMIKLFGKVA